MFFQSSLHLFCPQDISQLCCVVSSWPLANVRVCCSVLFGQQWLPPWCLPWILCLVNVLHKADLWTKMLASSNKSFSCYSVLCLHSDLGRTPHFYESCHSVKSSSVVDHTVRLTDWWLSKLFDITVNLSRHMQTNNCWQVSCKPHLFSCFSEWTPDLVSPDSSLMFSDA